MFKSGTLFLFVFLFHIAVFLHDVYTMYIPFKSFTLYHLHPLGILLFTVAWWGIYKKKKPFAVMYIALTIFEIIIYVTFQKFLFGDVFGKVLFPLDIFFCFILFALYKQHFNEQSTR